MDAVGGRTIDLEYTLATLFDAYRLIEGERVAGTGAIPVGRDHGYPIGMLDQALGQQPDSGRVEPVIVGNQNMHA